MTFVDLFEFCNRKVSKRRSINSRTNHSIFRWFLPLHWLVLDLLCFVWYISFRFVILHFVSFRFFVFRFVSLYFVSFRFISFRFVFVSQFSRTPKNRGWTAYPARAAMSAPIWVLVCVFFNLFSFLYCVGFLGFFFGFFCLRHVSCVPNVDGVSGLSI